MDDQLKLAYEFASMLSRELITLSAGILALSVTFVKDIIRTPRKSQLILLATSWCLYLMSILAGIWSLMGLTGSLAPLTGLVPVSGIDENARVPAIIQFLFFACATLIFVISGVSSLIGFKGDEEGKASQVALEQRPAAVTPNLGPQADS